MHYWFSWNGMDCRQKGLLLNEMPLIIKPEERVSHIEIPGRSGELTILEGTDIYNSYIQTVQVAATCQFDAEEAERWLRGSGYVTFCGQPTLRQAARVINAVEFRKHSKNSLWWEAQVQFYCSPMKEPLTETTVEVTESGTVITNPGSIESRPLIAITGSGDVSLRIGDRELLIYGLQSGWQADSEMEWVTENGSPLMGVFAGEFPRFAPGGNAVQFTGNITSLSILGRWRYL